MAGIPLRLYDYGINPKAFPTNHNPSLTGLNLTPAENWGIRFKEITNG